MRYLIDYCDGQRFVISDDQQSDFHELSQHYAILELSEEESASLERHFEEAQYWQKRFKECDNEWYDQKEKAFPQ